MAETNSSYTTSEDRNSESEHHRRAKTVKEEIERLCAPIYDLIKSGHLDKAIFLCRLQLTEPLAYQHGQKVATSEELRVTSNFALGQALYSQYVAPNAPFPDTTRDNEVVDAFKKAAEGAIRHYDQYSHKISIILDNLWLAVTRQTGVAARIVYCEYLVQLYRKVLARIMSTAPAQGEKHREYHKDTVVRMLSVLDHLAEYYIAANRRVDAVKIFKDSVEVLESYTGGLESDVDIHYCYVHLLCNTALLLQGTKWTIAETRTMFSHLEKCRTIVKANREDKNADVFQNMKVENQYAAGLVYLSRSLPSDWNGPTAADLLCEASGGYRCTSTDFGELF